MPTFATPVLVWKIIALLSLPWTAFFLVPYLFKCVMYPHKASTAGRGSSVNAVCAMATFCALRSMSKC